MNRTQIYTVLTEIFHDIFDDETLVLSDSMTAEDVEDWDSLTHISLIAAIEDSLDVRFDMKQVLTLKNVGELVDNIEILTGSK